VLYVNVLTIQKFEANAVKLLSRFGLKIPFSKKKKKVSQNKLK